VIERAEGKQKNHHLNWQFIKCCRSYLRIFN